MKNKKTEKSNIYPIHSRGNLKAVITLVEYGDFECKDTRDAYPIIKRLQQKLKSNLLFVFRHFPLTDLKNINPYAKKAAVASEIASSSGKFWEFFDKIFEDNCELSNEYLIQLMKQIGIKDVNIIKLMNDTKYSKIVQREFQAGILKGVKGTPTFFINDTLYKGSNDYTEILDALNSVRNRRFRVPNHHFFF